jgi:hypothetical protein
VLRPRGLVRLGPGQVLVPVRSRPFALGPVLRLDDGGLDPAIDGVPDRDRLIPLPIREIAEAEAGDVRIDVALGFYRPRA